MIQFTKDNLPVTGWNKYKKKITTDAVRISGPFQVTTLEVFWNVLMDI